MIVSLMRGRLLTWATVSPAWCLARARVPPMGTPRLHSSAAAPTTPGPRGDGWSRYFPAPVPARESASWHQIGEGGRLPGPLLSVLPRPEPGPLRVQLLMVRLVDSQWLEDATLGWLLVHVASHDPAGRALNREGSLVGVAAAPA